MEGRLKYPYLSLVVYSRNDDFTGNMLLRLQTSLNLVMEQLERHSIESEIVIVEWNPPPDRARLREALSLPASSSMVTVRIVSVDPCYHRRYKYSELKLINGSVACNVGVRRSRGLFVLPRVSDAFYSEALVKFLADKSLSPECVYRCNRHDVDSAVLDNDLESLTFLEACARNVVHSYTRNERWDYVDAPHLHTNACGDFLLMAKEYWHTIRGWHEPPDVFCLDVDGLALHAVCAAGANEVVMPDECCVFKLRHGSMYDQRVRELKYNHWGALMYLLRKLGFSRKMEHRLRVAVNFPKRRIRDAPEIVLDSCERNFLERIEKWANGIGPFCLNDQDWGLATVDLPEHTMCRAGWDR